MSDPKPRSDELLQQAQGWIDDGMAPADAVEALIQAANRVIDRHNLEYEYLAPTKKS